MTHSTQLSTDTTSRFIGIFIHDGTTDIHRDVFGGANWENDVWCGSTTGGLLPDAATLNVRSFVHRFAPHGEAQGQDLGPSSLSVFAPAGVAGNVPLFNAAFKSIQHGVHRDDLAALVLAAANNGSITGYIGIVAAVHWIPAQDFFFVSSQPQGQVSSSSVEGAAAITVDSEEGVLLGALGLIGSLKSEPKAVHLRMGPKKIGLLEDQSQFEKLDRGGIACTFEIGLDADIIEQLGEAELSIEAELQDGTRWESSLVPASSFEVSRKLAGGCRPASVTATKWGPWKPTEEQADSAAYAKARDAAGRACHGGCTESELKCEYTEQEAELLETEERTTQDERKEYRVKVRSKGTCECQ